MGLLTFALNVTLDGCCDHREMIADDAMLRYYTRLMDEAGGMLWGRTTYEMMESAWPGVARDPKAKYPRCVAGAPATVLPLQSARMNGTFRE